MVAARAIIVGSNDIGFQDLPFLKEFGLSASASQFGFSGSAVHQLYDEQFDVVPVPLGEATATAIRRLRLGQRVDAFCLMSCTPYGRGRELAERFHEIRALADQAQCFPAIPARTLPVVLADAKYVLAGRAVETVSGDWLSIIPPESNPRDLAQLLRNLGPRALDAVFHVTRSWSLELMVDLEVGGLIVARTPDGQLVPRVALRRKAKGGRMHLPEFDPSVAYRAGLPIFAADVDLDREPFNAFYTLLNDANYRSYATLDRSKPEIVLHRFFDKNMGILLGGTHERFLSEAALQIRNGTRSSMRPDFLLRPVECAPSRFQILELKLPSAAVFRKLHGSVEFTKTALRAVEQVRNYRRRLIDPANAPEVERVLKTRPTDFDLAVLIGMREAEEPTGLLREVSERTGVVDVRIVRYNELHQRQLRLHGPESPILRT